MFIFLRKPAADLLLDGQIFASDQGHRIKTVYDDFFPYR